MFGYGRTQRQSVNYTISYRAAHAAAVRYSWVLQEQNPSEFIPLYNTAQFKKAADTYWCDSLLFVTQQLKTPGSTGGKRKLK